MIKDNTETRELPTTAGSLALAGNLTGRDAPLVARLGAWCWGERRVRRPEREYRPFNTKRPGAPNSAPGRLSRAGARFIS